MSTPQTRCDQLRSRQWLRGRRQDPTYCQSQPLRGCFAGSYLERYIGRRTLSKPHVEVWLRSNLNLGETVKGKQDDVLAHMERVVKIGDESAFLNLIKATDWQERSPVDFMRAIDLALEAGAHLAARSLSIQGVETHPDNAELQKYACVLAPPKVLANSEPRNINVAANVEWLNTNRNNYRGKWVAIKDGALLGAADSHCDLIAQVGETKGRGILVTPIY